MVPQSGIMLRMTSKEVYLPQERKGIVDKGLNFWQKVNKFTLVGWVGAGTAGVMFGMPWLATLGFASAAVDGAQIVALNEVQRRRREKSTREGLKKSGTIVAFPQNIRRTALPQAA